MSVKYRKNFIGEVIGDMTCIARTEIKTPRGTYKCLYKCSCGGERLTTRNSVVRSLKLTGKASCGCKAKTNMKDITGFRKNKLIAIENTFTKSNNGDYVWKFQCECGNITETTVGRFNHGSTKSCGCAVKDAQRNRTNYHGLSDSKAHKTWCAIKERSFNTNSEDYPLYGSRGIVMSEEFKDNFKAFYDHIGDPPSDGKRYSIDRIDNTKGYERGNIRWATGYQQARNKGMQKNNSSGIKGVAIDNKGTKEKPYLYAKCQWRDLDGVSQSKSFSVNKYGEELAMFLAQEYRILMLERLNLLGAGYTHQHIYGEPE